MREVEVQEEPRLNVVANHYPYFSLRLVPTSTLTQQLIDDVKLRGRWNGSNRRFTFCPSGFDFFVFGRLIFYLCCSTACSSDFRSRNEGELRDTLGIWRTASPTTRTRLKDYRNPRFQNAYFRLLYRLNVTEPDRRYSKYENTAQVDRTSTICSWRGGGGVVYVLLQKGEG